MKKMKNSLHKEMSEARLVPMTRILRDQTQEHCMLFGKDSPSQYLWEKDQTLLSDLGMTLFKGHFGSRNREWNRCEERVHPSASFDLPPDGRLKENQSFIELCGLRGRR